jgi:hypothetical protein
MKKGKRHSGKKGHIKISLMGFYERIAGFSYCLILVIWLGTGVFFSPPANAQEKNIPLSISKTKQTNSYYFLLSPLAKIKITQKSNLLLNSNVELNNNIVGEGKLIIKSDKLVLLDAKDHQINTLIVKENTKIQLEGHLQILRKFRVYGGVKIALGNFNLVLAPEVYFTNFQQICKNSLGRLICLSNTTHNISDTNTNNFTPGTMGVFYILARTILFSQIISCSAFYFIDSYLPVIPDTDTPPPRSV